MQKEDFDEEELFGEFDHDQILGSSSHDEEEDAPGDVEGKFLQPYVYLFFVRASSLFIVLFLLSH
jgi:hypothetical protein